MAGRKQTSAAAKVTAGNPGHRAIPIEVDFSSAGSIGKPPSWLNAEAKKEFVRVAFALKGLDLLYSTDMSVLSSYSVAYARWMAAERQITKEGTTLKVVGSTGQSKYIKHPSLMVSSESQKQMIRAGGLLGLNPVDRKRLDASPKDTNNPFTALLNGGNDEDED